MALNNAPKTMMARRAPGLHVHQLCPDARKIHGGGNSSHFKWDRLEMAVEWLAIGLVR